MSVCGTVQAISPIEPEENWYVYRSHAISIENSVTRLLSYQNNNIIYAEILVHQNLINYIINNNTNAHTLFHKCLLL